MTYTKAKTLENLKVFSPKQGIFVQHSFPHTSKQNRLAEREYRHILDYFCAELLATSYLEKFWCLCHQSSLILHPLEYPSL